LIVGLASTVGSREGFARSTRTPKAFGHPAQGWRAVRAPTLGVQPSGETTLKGLNQRGQWLGFNPFRVVRLDSGYPGKRLWRNPGL